MSANCADYCADPAGMIRGINPAAGDSCAAGGRAEPVPGENQRMNPSSEQRMAEVKKLFQLTQIHELQGVKLSLEEGEAVLKFTQGCNGVIKKMRGELAFDSEPAGFFRTLGDLRRTHERCGG